MEWISVKKELPRKNREVTVWVIYEGDKHGTSTDSYIPVDQNNHYYDPYSNIAWAMGSASGFKVTHWMKVEKPNKNNTHQ